MRKLLALALAATVAGSVACAHGPTTNPASQPDARTTLTVRNDRFYDMNIYVVADGGLRTRLGTVSATSSATFTIPPRVVGNTNLLHFLADPIGPSGVSRSEQMTVHPGDAVSLQITP